VIFGSQRRRRHDTGADTKDRLYGGGGSDVLNGLDGEDTRSNAGTSPRGGRSHDILVGGAGSDELRGEGGNDRLLGAPGSDVYFFNSGEVPDTIVDVDGLVRLFGMARR